ncbi:hypothetical protein BaRGS_00026599 [Batillaria attramentaria]|uniref:ZU5 domain-containing protein n=1 Tax=Batillaria attramentaria TaxID=370345 RepID=A0ABD0K4F5_9CAEN
MEVILRRERRSTTLAVKTQTAELALCDELQFTGKLTSDGGEFQADSDVKLIVPKNAIPPGKKITVWGAVCVDLDFVHKRCCLKDDEIVVSPAVEYLTKKGFTFQKPVQIQLPHFAPDSSSPYTIRVYQFHKQDDGEIYIQELEQEGSESLMASWTSGAYSLSEDCVQASWTSLGRILCQKTAFRQAGPLGRILCQKIAFRQAGPLGRILCQKTAFRQAGPLGRILCQKTAFRQAGPLGRILCQKTAFRHAGPLGRILCQKTAFRQAGPLGRILCQKTAFRQAGPLGRILCQKIAFRC